MHDDPGSQTDAERLTDLEEQGLADRATIARLKAQSVVDQEILAALAEQGLADRAQIEQLQIALIASRRIGAAVGILMATHRIDEDGAFERLRIASQNTNRKLRDVADDVVYTGALPP